MSENKKPTRATLSIITGRIYLWCPPKSEGGLSQDDLDIIHKQGMKWYPRGCYVKLWSPQLEDMIEQHFGLTIEPDDQPDNLIARVTRYQRYASNDEATVEYQKERLSSGAANTVRRIRLAEGVLKRKEEEAIYWHERVQSALHYADRKDSPRTVTSRIKRLTRDRTRFERYFNPPINSDEKGALYGKGNSVRYIKHESLEHVRLQAQRWIDHLTDRIEFEKGLLVEQGGSLKSLEPAPRRKSEDLKDGVEKGCYIEHTVHAHAKSWTLVSKVIRVYPLTLYVEHPTEGEYFEAAKAWHNVYNKDKPFDPKPMKVYRRWIKGVVEVEHVQASLSF